MKTARVGGLMHRLEFSGRPDLASSVHPTRGRALEAVRQAYPEYEVAVAPEAEDALVSVCSIDIDEYSSRVVARIYRSA